MLALPPVLPEVNIVLLMAREAGRVQLDLIGRLFVAAGAHELGVCPAECESCLLAVIELPDLPAVRGMAACTVLAECSLVYVVAFVAVDAAAADIFILRCDVALLAGDRNVQTHQGK